MAYLGKPLAIYSLVIIALLLSLSFVVSRQNTISEPTSHPTDNPEKDAVSITSNGDLPPDVVVDPDTGQWVVVNELTILASGQDVASLVTQYGGQIVLSVSQTGTYQVRFPVSDLNQLKAIKKDLEKKGVQVILAIVLRPPRPGEDQ